MDKFLANQRKMFSVLSLGPGSKGPLCLRRSARLNKSKSFSGGEDDLIQKTLICKSESSGSKSERFHGVLSVAEAATSEDFSTGFPKLIY